MNRENFGPFKPGAPRTGNLRPQLAASAAPFVLAAKMFIHDPLQRVRGESACVITREKCNAMCFLSPASFRLVWLWLLAAAAAAAAASTTGNDASGNDGISKPRLR